MSLKGLKRKGLPFYLLLTTSLLLVVSGVVMLARTFTHYNALFLTRQDDQLAEMASAADENIAVQLNNLRADLTYVLGRRGFVLAEETWAGGGGTEDLLFRMQENLVSQNQLIHALLALKDGTIFLSTDGRTDYRFPAGADTALRPCFSPEGTLYLALIERTDKAAYAALLDVRSWFAELARVNTNDAMHLMLLGSGDTLLLHQWQDAVLISDVEQTTAEGCDVQALQKMQESRSLGRALTATYHLTYPGDGDVHEMRMMAIPAQQSVNGYFTVGLTGDYDEIIRPMQQAAVQLIVYGGMVVVGVALLMFMAVSLIQRARRRDQELLRLQEKNAQTQQLLEKTQELAHHQRLETIGTLASSIAHEFNNLLTPIMGYSILTLEGLPEGADELADNVAEIYEASRKAKTIISRLSDLSRKNTELTFRYLSLDEMVHKALQVASPAQPAHVETLTRLNSGDDWLYGNETQLSQLLLNLIINAFHAMDETGGTLTLTTAADEGHITLRVADTGAGIPPEALPHIFEPFYTTKESGKGTGLGLAIVHQVTESHRGKISVQSEPGAGTVFTLRFPLASMENEGES